MRVPTATTPAADPALGEDATREAVATLLQLLARWKLGAGDACSHARLVHTPGLALSVRERRAALARLVQLGWLREDEAKAEGIPLRLYMVTPDGAAAVQAAAPAPRKPAAAAGQSTYLERLWQLLRIRKMLTPAEAAETLCDAAVGNVETRRKLATRYLGRWVAAGAVQRSAKRLPGGQYRYVLLADAAKPPCGARGHAGSQAAAAARRATP